MKTLLLRIYSQTLKNSLWQFVMFFKLRIHQLLSWQLNQLICFALLKHVKIPHEISKLLGSRQFDSK